MPVKRLFNCTTVWLNNTEERRRDFFKWQCGDTMRSRECVCVCVRMLFWMIERGDFKAPLSSCREAKWTHTNQAPTHSVCPPLAIVSGFVCLLLWKTDCTYSYCKRGEGERKWAWCYCAWAICLWKVRITSAATDMQQSLQLQQFTWNRINRLISEILCVTWAKPWGQTHHNNLAVQTLPPAVSTGVLRGRKAAK